MLILGKKLNKRLMSNDDEQEWEDEDLYDPVYEEYLKGTKLNDKNN